MNEIWKNTSIEHYQVSNLGNIKSVGHYGYSRHKKNKKSLVWRTHNNPGLH